MVRRREVPKSKYTESANIKKVNLDPRVAVQVIRAANLSIGTASAHSAKFRGIRPRIYIEDLL